MVTILDHKMPFKPNNAAHILQYGCNAGAGAYSNSRHTISYPKLIPLRTQNHTISYPSPSNAFRDSVMDTTPDMSTIHHEITVMTPPRAFRLDETYTMNVTPIPHNTSDVRRDISIALTPPRLDDSMDITPPNSPDVTVPELSFNVTARDIEMPEQHEKVSLLDEPPALIDPGDDVRDVHITYEVVEGGTIRGKPMLVESSGYTYTIKRIRGPTTEWWCTIRGKALRCHATVRQRGDAFTKGRHDHIHPADPGALKTTKVKVSGGTRYIQICGHNSTRHSQRRSTACRS